MRTYGRIVPDPENAPDVKQWVEVSTDPVAGDDYVWLTTLCQNLKLNLGESPFYASAGIPARQSVIQQIYPDLYVTLTQQRFAPRFASLLVAKVPGDFPNYNVNVTLNNGVPLEVAVPT